MTGRTTTGYGRGNGGVIELGAQPAGGIRVAAITLRGGRKVSQRLGQGIDAGIAATVATRTGTAGARMIHLRTSKRRGVFMAGITLHGRRKMTNRFTQRPRTVVTISTTTIDRWRCYVIKSIGIPGDSRRMTLVTLSRRRNVIRPLGLSIDRNKCPAVAGITLTGTTGMAHGRRRKSRRIQVTGATGCDSRHMANRLAQGI